MPLTLADALVERWGPAITASITVLTWRGYGAENDNTLSAHSYEGYAKMRRRLDNAPGRELYRGPFACESSLGGPP